MQVQIRNSRNRMIGWTQTDGTLHWVYAYRVGVGMVGYYRPDENATRRANGSFYGNHNQLSALISEAGIDWAGSKSMGAFY